MRSLVAKSNHSIPVRFGIDKFQIKVLPDAFK